MHERQRMLNMYFHAMPGLGHVLVAEDDLPTGHHTLFDMTKH